MKLILIVVSIILASSCSSIKKNSEDKVYVVERERESLFVLDNQNEKIIKDLGNLNHATMKFRGNFGYVLARDGSISKIDVTNDVVVKKVTIGKSGIGLTFIGDYIAIVNYDPNSVVILDKDLNIVKTIETSSRNVGIKTFKNFLVFSLMDKNEIWVLDSSKNFESVKKFEKVGQLPFDALIKDEKYIVGFFNEAAIGILDLNLLRYEKVILKDVGEKLVYKVPHFGYWGIVNNNAIVPIVADKKLLVLDLNTSKAIKEIELIGNPVFASVSPDKSTLIVNYSGDKEDFISVVDLKSFTKTKDINVAKRVMHLRFSQDGKKAFVTSYFDNSLKTLETDNWNIIDVKKVATPSGIFLNGMKE